LAFRHYAPLPLTSLLFDFYARAHVRGGGHMRQLSALVDQLKTFDSLSKPAVPDFGLREQSELLVKEQKHDGR
jgi:hypothetical protein